MKKLIAALMTLALLVSGLAMFALAEETEKAENYTEGKFNTLIEDGQFIIQVDAKGDLAWVAYDMGQDPSVVELAIADTIEDTFVARYAPVGDGDVTVGVRHYMGIACDEMMTWDLHVENGTVQDVTDGSYITVGDTEEMDAVLVGEWLEAGSQFANMTIEKNPERGWDVEIAAPLTHGAYVFKTTIQYDCELDSFVYDKGKFWEAPITESDEEVELGEASVAGTAGSFIASDKDGKMTILWYDDNNPDKTVEFERAEAEA